MGRNIKINIRGLETYKESLSNLSNEQLEEFSTETLKELGARLLTKVIKRTPTGVKPKFTGKKTIRVKGEGGKTDLFLTKEGAILQEYWSGYSGGTLKRGWTSETEAEAKNGGENKNILEYAKSLPIKKTGNKSEISIINPVHWASYVEYGHRQTPGRYVPAIGKRLKYAWVDGRFMLTESEDELTKEAPDIVEKRLKKFLKECFRND